MDLGKTNQNNKIINKIRFKYGSIIDIRKCHSEASTLYFHKIYLAVNQLHITIIIMAQ